MNSLLGRTKLSTGPRVGQHIIVI